MKIPDYYLRIISMPPTVRGVTLPNDDGTFSIYINSLYDKKSQREALEHELAHMARDHFYKDESIAVQELEANGLASDRTLLPAVSQKHIRCYNGLRGLENTLISLGAIPTMGK